MAGPLRPYPPPPSLMAVVTFLFCFFQSKNTRKWILTTFFLPTIFGLKERYFLPKIATYDFANIASIDILICRLNEKISFIFKKQQNK